MPISRYQIRNEYSLADPELYKAADKDDPEALLEGVAMAGLVGVLRQLGDLAEFAAEVFHDLHEEVIATAARGHSLKGRIQQLEADFPSIEKAFLSQTNHSSFFYNGGTDWHPNMRMDQNLITRGDLPRFIMDSYEECRGPPRLFLLDKFDVAGAGACLKRYTDPSFFKVEGSGLGITDADVQREKRTRKGKKRGSRWSNGETPEVLQTSHAKLHQLLLEERIENNISDPARPVKLKRRLNGFPFDLKTGGSYMEKFLKIPSPEQKVVNGISVSSSPLKLPASDTYESGLDIRSESPDKKFTHGSLSPPLDMEGTLQNLSMDKLNGVTFDNGSYEFPKANRSFEGDNILSIFHEEVGEKEIAVDGESKTECSIDDYQSDGVASEVDDYVDALATMESEMDTDSELRAKSDLHILSNRRRMSGYVGTEAEHQATSSDSQSMGSSMLSDDGNSSSKKQISSSYSESRSISAENIPLGVVSIKGISNKIREDKGTARSLKHERVNEDIERAPSAEHADDDGGTKVAEIPVYRSDHSEQTMPNLVISPPTQAWVDADSTMRDHVMVEGETEEILCAHNAPETELINDTGNETNLIVSIHCDSRTLDAPMRSENDTSPRVSAENSAVTGFDDKYLIRDESFSTGLSEIPWHSRDASSVADSSKSQHLEDLKTLENHSSLYPTYQPLDELGDDNSNLKAGPPESSPEDLPVKWLDNEDPISISSASDHDGNALTDASASPPNTINIAQEDDKSNNSLDSISQTENAEDGMETEADNQIGLPISKFPRAEEESPKWSLPELETHNTVVESDHIFSAPDDVIFPAIEEQSLERSLPELDTHDTSLESDQIVSVPDDVIFPAVEEQSLKRSLPELNTHDTSMESEQIVSVPDDVALPAIEERSLERSLPELDSHGTATESDHIVAVPDDMTPSAEEIVADLSSPGDSTIDVHSKDLHKPGITEDIHPLDPAENQFDTPNPDITHLEEIHFERSVMESAKDVHSNDLHTSGIPDGFQPPDPAINSIGDQIDSPIPVISDLDEQSLDLTRSKIETHGKGSGSDDIISGLNLMIPPSGEIAVDSEPTIESPRSSDLKKPQASVKIDDVLHLDSAEVDTSCNAEQILHESSSSEEGEKMEEVILGTDLAERDATNLMTSAYHESFTRKLDVNDADADADAQADAERDDADTAPSVGYDDNDKDRGVTLSDIKKLDEESLSNFEESNQNQMEEAAVSVQDIYTKSDVLTELGIPEVASPALASDLSDTLHHDHTELEVLGNVPDSCAQVESSLDHNNAATTSIPLQRSGLGTNALTSQESNLSDYCGDISSLPIHHDREEYAVKPSPDQLDKVETRMLQNAAQASIEPVSQVEQKGSLDHFDLDGCYNTASGSFLVNLSSQQSVSKLMPQDNCSIGDIDRPKDPFSSSTGFGLLPEAKIKLEDMPPLPPLPPVQWRMGKQQHASFPSNVSAFPSFSMSITDQKAQPLNPFLPHYDIAGENTHPVDGYTSHHPVSDGPFLSQEPPIVHHGSNTNSLPPFGETRSIDQLLPSPETSDQVLPDDSRVGEKDIVQPSLTSLPEVTSVGAAPTHASSLPHDEASPLHHQIKPETGSNDKKLDQGSAPSDGNIIVRDDDVLPPKIDNEQPQNVIFSPMGEFVWPSQDDGKANGGLTTKLPRPRNPLIDAVIANDQSKLRKVAEHPRPQKEKVDERDSLLEQIRAKSFNLKPAVVSRPTIQGPTTNLRVAAILEKAKTIRQAFAGSDEDDDNDSWSDS